MTALTIHAGVQYVYVATTQNNLYKINAKTGDVVKSRNIGVPFMATDLGGEYIPMLSEIMAYVEQVVTTSIQPLVFLELVSSILQLVSGI